MSTRARIPQSQVTGPYGALVKRMGKKMGGGELPEGVGVMWHNRKVLNFGFGLGRKSDKWDACDDSLKAYASMAAAAKIGCEFCLDLHYFKVHNEGMDERKAREVPRWRESDVFTPLERDAMEYAEAMSATPPTVTDELSDRLLAQIGPAALVELAASIALMNFYSRSNVALGISAHGFAASCDLAPLARPSEPVASAA
ncbi:carboxymuconolactone decarboxylase family protein [Thermoleophilia bacterium SCSIO 60948]|nr:carboxymuconolactone decarboxylase family protein [Thermoleophilia bacterium SCSIO 60948]